MGQTPPVQTYNEEVNTFYIEDVCGEADGLFRFAYAVLLDQDAAFAAVRAAYRRALDQLTELSQKPIEDVRRFLIASVWQDVEDKHFRPSSTPTSPLGQKLGKLGLMSRAALFAIDICGCSVPEAQVALKRSEDELRKVLAEGRKFLVQQWRTKEA